MVNATSNLRSVVNVWRTIGEAQHGFPPQCVQPAQCYRFMANSEGIGHWVMTGWAWARLRIAKALIRSFVIKRAIGIK